MEFSDVLYLFHCNFLKISRTLSIGYILCESDNRVTGIYLQENGLVGTIPTHIGLMTNLKTLDLWSNNLTGKLPTQLGQLVGLTSFSCSSNALTGGLPPQLGGLTSLVRLYVNLNDFGGPLPPQQMGLCIVQQTNKCIPCFNTSLCDRKVSHGADLGDCFTLFWVVKKYLQ